MLVISIMHLPIITYGFRSYLATTYIIPVCAMYFERGIKSKWTVFTLLQPVPVTESSLDQTLSFFIERYYYCKYKSLKLLHRDRCHLPFCSCILCYLKITNFTSIICSINDVSCIFNALKITLMFKRLGSLKRDKCYLGTF